MNAPLSVRQFALSTPQGGFNPLAATSFLEGIGGPQALAGFQLLSPETQALLVEKVSQRTLTQRDVQQLYAIFTETPDARLPDSAHARMYSFMSRPAPSLLSESTQVAPVLGERDEYTEHASSVIETAIKMMINAWNRESNMGIPAKEEIKAHHTPEKINQSVFAEPPKPVTLEEAQTIADRNRGEINGEYAATTDYRDRQVSRMTPLERETYEGIAGSSDPEHLGLENTVAGIYSREQESIGKKFFDAFEKQNGMPSAKALSDADLKLQTTISKNSYLKAKKIRPLEFQILHARHQAFNHPGVPEAEKLTLEKHAYAMEARYVIETLTAKVTKLVEAGRPESEIEPYETLAAEACDVYDRLMGTALASGSTDKAPVYQTIQSTDFERLQVYRQYVFPFEIDWNHESMADINQAMKDHEDAQREHIKASHDFMLNMATASTRLMEGSELFSIEREEADFKFQVVRMEQQLARLNKAINARVQADLAADGSYMSKMREKLHLESNGETINAEVAQQYAAAFAAALEDYKEKHKAYIKKWREFLSGDDVQTREHGRNAADKDTCFALFMKCQLGLEWLYHHYDVREDPNNNDSKKLRPTCVSATYVNQARNIDKAFENNSVNGEAMESFFRAAWQLVPELLIIFGLEIPGTGIKLTPGRKPLDYNLIDRHSLTAGGSHFSSEEGLKAGGTIFGGFKDHARLLQQIQIHPDLALLAGALDIFAPQDQEELSPFHHLALETGNHNGSMEFMLVLQLLLAGIHAPQMAQGGAAEAPGFKEYLKYRAFVLERSEGGSEAVRKIIRFYSKHPALFMYPSGTRIVTPGGGDLSVNYSKNPALILSPRIITDRATSGMVGKIVQTLIAEAGKDAQSEKRLDPSLYFMNMMVAVMAQAGLGLGEPTWFLGSDKVAGLMGNLSIKNMFNFANLDLPQMIAIGGIFSSLGFPTEKEIKATSPELFVHANGIAYSERESYIRYLQVISHIISAMQRYTAMTMQSIVPPEPTEEQKEKLEEAKKMTPEEQIKDTHEKMSRWVDERFSRTIGEKAPPKTLEAIAKERKEDNQGKKEGLGRPEVPKNTEAEKTRLNKILSEEEASQLVDHLTGMPKKKVLVFERNDLEKHQNALKTLRECAQRGASYAQRLGDGELALDGDNVLWDHLFITELGNLPEMASDELVDFLMGPHGSGAEIKEQMNVNPMWVAFIIGYKKQKGHAPVLFSSTMPDRLKALASHIGKNPVITALFQALLDQGDDLTPERAVQLLTAEEENKQSRIITRKRIAEYVETMMARYVEAGTNVDAKKLDGSDWFTAIEKADIKAMLKSHGDVHLKYRGIFAYRTLVDDRWENADHAASYNSDPSDAVAVYRPEAFTDNSFVQYIGTLPKHVSWRLHQARTGDPLRIMRNMDDPSQQKLTKGRVEFSRHSRTKAVSGLIDQPAEFTFTRAQARTGFSEPHDRAKRATTHALAALMAAAEKQRTGHVESMKQLIVLFEELEKTSDLPPVRYKNALNRLKRNLSLNAKDHKPFKEEADFELLEWLIHPDRLDDVALRDTALNCISILRDRTYIQGMDEAMPPPKHVSGIAKWKKKYEEAKKIVGKIFKKVGQVAAFSSNISTAYLDEPLNAELKPAKWFSKEIFPVLRKYVTSPVEQSLLLRLGRHFEDPKKRPMKMEDKIRAFGIITERMGFKVSQQILDDAMMGKGKVNLKVQASLRAHRVEINRELEDFIPKFAEFVKTLPALYSALMKSYETGKPAFESGKKLVGRPEIRQLAWAHVKVGMNFVYDSSKERHKTLHPESEPESEEQKAKTYAYEVVVDTMLENGIRVFGEDSIEGMVLNKLRWDIVEVGLEQAVRNAVGMYEDFEALNSNGDVKLVVDSLLQDDDRKAWSILTDRARTLKVKNAQATDKEEGKKAFDRFFQAAWIQVIRGNPEIDSLRQAKLTALAREVYKDVFNIAAANDNDKNGVERAA